MPVTAGRGAFAFVVKPHTSLLMLLPPYRCVPDGSRVQTAVSVPPDGYVEIDVSAPVEALMLYAPTLLSSRFRTYRCFLWLPVTALPTPEPAAKGLPTGLSPPAVITNAWILLESRSVA